MKNASVNNNIIYYISFIFLIGILLSPIKSFAGTYSSWVGNDLVSTGNLNNLTGEQFTATDNNTPDYIYTYTNYTDCSGTHDAAYDIRRVSDNVQVAYYYNDSCSYRGNGVLRYSKFFGTLVSGTQYYVKPSHNVAYEIYGSNTKQKFNYILDNAIDPNPPSPPNTVQPTIIELISPTNNSTTTATTTTFTLRYYVNSVTNNSSSTQPTQIRIGYYYFPAGGINFINIPITNLQLDTFVTVSTSTPLITNRNYGWYAVLNTTTIDQGCSSVNLASVFCAFQHATAGLTQIATTPTWRFTIGTNPYSSISNLTNAVFNDISGTGNVEIMGECTLVATSTCDATSPSTYMGCLTNVLVATLCPSTSVLNYATSTMTASLQNRLPFAMYYSIIKPIQSITGSTTPVQGSNIVVNTTITNASTTIFSWQDAHDFMYDTIGTTVINFIIFVEWAIWTFAMIWLIIKFF